MSIATSQIRSAPFVHIFSKFGHHDIALSCFMLSDELKISHLVLLMKLKNCEGRSIRGSKDLCTSILTVCVKGFYPRNVVRYF
ncbi:hypothetical protein SADUNF_Sadunf03G0014800 [Salix dunnii]|uniref:Uncharacterized protein n=1 Tax=Salix dunnii TaxID=1413687 RepID=A0A835N450_9ROSI|nr:hypothetical protein SADUNF_Sadunf03G0014800 [Salix dunnii]